MHLNDEEIRSLRRIIKMYIGEEHRHFQENEEDNHVYYDFLRLQNKVNKKNSVLKF